MHDGDSKYQLLLFSCVPRVLVKSDLANPNLDRNLPETLAAALSSLASSSTADKRIYRNRSHKQGAYGPNPAHDFYSSHTLLLLFLIKNC